MPTSNVQSSQLAGEGENFGSLKLGLSSLFSNACRPKGLLIMDEALKNREKASRAISMGDFNIGKNFG